MKKTDVKVGKCYAAKVSGKMATVRIDAANPRGGWDATNLRTNKKVRIRSPQRLRHETRAPGTPKSAIPKTVEAVKKGDLTKRVTVPTGAKKAKKVTKDAKPVAKRHTGERGATGGESGGKPMSLLDAAAHLLSLGTGDPMRCKDIVDLAIARDLWRPRTGKTPANTLYAALSREINVKGNASRFVKAERGKFALASKR